MINIIKGVDIIDHVTEYDVTLVSANLYATMGGGFQIDVKRLYPYVHQSNINTRYGDITRLGTILESTETGKPTFCLCYIFKQVNTRPDLKLDNLEYDALENCLKLINVLYKGKKIASTILGTSQFDGNGDRERVLEIFNQTLTDVNVDIYDFEQETKAQKWFKAFYKGREIKKIDKEAWKEFVKESKKKFNQK